MSQPHDKGNRSAEPDITLERTLPNNLEAERSVLGAILLDDQAMVTAQELLRKEDLYLPGHKVILDAMWRLTARSRPIDLITLKEELKRTDELEQAGGAAYLASLTDGLPFNANIKHHIDIIKENATLRRLIQISSETMSRGYQAEDRAQDILADLKLTAAELDYSRDGRSAFPIFRSAAEVMEEPPAVEIVQGIVLQKKTTILTAESTTGKTFVLLSIGAAVESGMAWLGRTVQRGSVAYVTYEGDDLRRRLEAIKERQGCKLENFHFLRAYDPLSPIIDHNQREISSPGAIQLKAQLADLSGRLAREGKPPIRLLIIDTLRASLNGSEDSSENANTYLREIRRILALIPDAGAILAHHTGWEGKRERGSSSFRGNVDLTLILNLRGEDPVQGIAYLALVNPKIRDEAKTEPLGFVRRQVSVNRSDPRGEPLTSCIIEADCRSAAEREAEIEAAEDIKNRVTDLKALKAIAKNPSLATSKEGVRLAMGVRREAALEIIARLIDRGWLDSPEKQRKPYTVTEAGKVVIEEAK